MKEHIVELKDMTDSREFMDRKVPNFMVIFIYLVLTMAVSALIWMWFSEIDIVVKATGIVRPDKNVSIVINVNSGNIKEINYADGKEVKEGETLYIVDTTSLELQKEVSLKSKEKSENELSKLKKLEKSIGEKKNYFTESEIEYYNRYMSYRLKEEQLKLDYEQANTRYLQEQSLGLKFTTEANLNDLKAKSDYAKISLEKNRTETLFSIKSEILEKENEGLKFKNQLKDIEKNIELSRVNSPINGTVQVIKNYNTGDYINVGVEVVRIIPEGTKLKMEIAVDNKDISQIITGQKVKFRFLALPYKEYGIVEGEINKISGDISYDSKDSNMTYKVEADIPETKLYNRKGKEGFIKIGMASEIRIVARRKKVLYIVLEKLDFIDL